MSANNGGPAFPTPREWLPQDKNGMSLRDYLAAKAMQAMINGWPDSMERPETAKRAYLMADEMLKAREA